MDRITVENYRCFRERQSARLAPLTLLVGENSTGKTSFLALIRALWDVAFRDSIPDFQEAPYDLGTFQDIAHYRGGRGGRADSFEAEFDLYDFAETKSFSYKVVFDEQGGSPFPIRRRFTRNETWFEAENRVNGESFFRFRMPNDSEELNLKSSAPLLTDNQLFPLELLVWRISRGQQSDESRVEDSSSIDPRLLNKDYLDQIDGLANDFVSMIRLGYSTNRPFAGAPVRSRPRRTYDPTRPSRDPEGEYIPAYLARVSRRNQKEWKVLKNALESFGHSSGLFDEVSVKSLGSSDGAPFQIQVRKATGRSRGSRRNLIDVGYGVSQTLPVLTELLRDDAPSMFLLQQPEVHLHPKAQAALGSMFCNIAGKERQIIVETHSDYLIDRVRMDVRDGNTSLKHEDVSILYFESNGLDVKVHSLELDKDGNVQNQPDGYGQFFMDEMNRSIGL